MPLIQLWSFVLILVLKRLKLTHLFFLEPERVSLSLKRGWDDNLTFEKVFFLKKKKNLHPFVSTAALMNINSLMNQHKLIS